MDLEALAPLTELVAAPTALEEAAERIIAAHADLLPDLSRLIVLLPSLHAAAPFAHALVRAARCPTLVLPQLTTLPQLARQMPLTVEETPDLLREEMLYAALRAQGWFAEQDRWQITRALLRLFDELTLNRVGLPADAAGFTQRLAQAYGVAEGETLRFEAHLVHTLWRAHQDALAGQPDATTAYVMRLAQLARDAARPLYGIGLMELSPVEVECLCRYAERQPVRLFAPAVFSGEADPLQAVLAAAWEHTSPPLRERGRQLKSSLAQSPLAGRLALFGAGSLEEAARAAEHQVRQWLAEGRQRLAVVAQDRLAARRLRALLERAQILVEDETGWTLSTTSAASVVMRWLDLIAADFHHRELLDFLKSPLVFADLEAGARREAVYELEQLIRSRNLVSRLDHYLAAAQEGESESLPLLQRLAAAHRILSGQARPLGGWFDALFTTLDTLGITPALERDVAGRQLLDLLADLRQQAAAATHRFSLAEWRRFLDSRLEQATFRDPSIESPVVFTHLAAMRLRTFDGVILLGAGEDELPSRSEGGPFFNEAVRRELGLPTRREATSLERRSLALLLASSPRVLAIWQKRREGEEALPSPWLDGLATLHDLAWEQTLMAAEALPMLHGHAPQQAGTPRPAPRLAPHQVPCRISASGYRSLLACPYQYFARHVLGLNEEDEVQVEMEKQDFGNVVHDILARFHARHPGLAAAEAEAAEGALRRVSEEAFAPLTAQNYLNHAWKFRWEKLIPAYLAWQGEREKEGWQVREQEVARTVELPLRNGSTLLLTGKLDRLDARQGELAVLDYKTGEARRLKKNLERPGEDVQLPVYTLLAEKRVRMAGFLSLSGDKVELVPFPRDLVAEAEAIEARLIDLFDALHEGAPLRAQGVAETCAHCEMAGLCRRSFWGGE
jgi:ATP-dependent helicase/nuclease subunit B